MKARKLAFILSVTIGITSFSPCIANAYVYNGWENNNGHWYYYINGNKTSGWQNDRGTWYYLNSDGTMKTGWLYNNGSWYYLDETSGAMQSGWKWIGDNWYYMNPDGSMATGWKNVNDVWYYLNNDGSMKTGWFNDNGTWYYLNSDGSMVHDTSVDGYKLNSNGAWIEDDTSTSTNKSYTFTEGLNKFSVDSACSILNKQDKTTNSNYSPVSLFMALTVLSEGADNNTKTELMKALNISNPDTLSQDCQNLYDSISFNNKYGVCKIADSIWVDNDNNDVEFNEQTLKKIENEYKAGLFKCNLQSDDTASKISQWVSSHTNGKLGTDPNEFKVKDPQEVMEIFNAIYFKDAWCDQFSTEATNKDNFYLSDGSSVSTDFMHKSTECYIYSGNGYKISCLDFRSGNKMMFILPDKDKSPYDILDNGDTLQKAINSLSQDKGTFSEVNFSVPKFDYKTSMDINKCADDLGIKNIYDSNADFTKLSKKGNLHVSKIKQNASVTVNEEGTEAAAYTQISMDCGAAAVDSIEDMNLNRPFIFVINNTNNIPLFIGVVNNPTLN